MRERRREKTEEDADRERMRSRREGGRGCNEEEMLPEEEESMWRGKERLKYYCAGFSRVFIPLLTVLERKNNIRDSVNNREKEEG